MAAAWGTLTQFTITPGSLAAGSYRQSAGVQWDGASTPFHGLVIQVDVTWSATPTAGDYASLWLAQGVEGTTTNLPGDASGSDAAYTAGRTDAMTFLGNIVVAATTNKQEKTFFVPFPTQYGALVVQNNAASATFSAFEANYVTRLLA